MKKRKNQFFSLENAYKSQLCFSKKIFWIALLYRKISIQQAKSKRLSALNRKPQKKLMKNLFRLGS